jgi:ABC-type nitrate/sulfonate/bicarbonate transport system substrate-binding protein
VVVTHAAFADTHPRAMAELARGWLRIVDYLRTEREAATRRVAERLALPPAEVAAAFKLLPLADAEDNRRYLMSPNATMPAQIQRLTYMMTRAGLLTHPAPAASLLDTSVAQRVLHQDTP